MLAVAGLVAASGVFGVPAASAQGCANPSGTYAGEVPWGQRLIDPARLWPLTRGEGQLVAVVGTGVDGQNTQFAPGQLDGGAGTERTDCDGRGTIAAGIVGARPDPSTTFAGVAPAVRLLPIRYTPGGDGGDPGELAEAIDRAVDRRAGVILVAVPAVADSPALSGAVARARAAGAVVVSAASATQQGARTYPTATSGVLAVGSVNAAGEPVQTEAGDHVGIAAPGADLVSTSAGAAGAVAHRWPVTDPGLAAAYVAGVAALVRAYHPSLSGDQVVTRLTLTAHRPPSGGHDPRLGWGVLDAYAAVSSTLPADVPGPGALPPAASAPVVVPAAAPAPRPSDVTAGTIALAGVALAAAAGISVAAVRRARRRGWRPTRFTP
ncbi:S8 family serine peptidase [Amycolatopsis rifamycinica]|uniref:Peptidase S8 n=1 Tax=Amycolatopsis rifamycinica TaxID=287986 RepID=A0A066U9T1_9PSEU|nr:S8 family serine peptidase [Amycolatopsis rifamycinica]KDN20879.1 peptidase S8 [Amycolatopsis rifamycinica]